MRRLSGMAGLVAAILAAAAAGLAQAPTSSHGGRPSSGGRGRSTIDFGRSRPGGAASRSASPPGVPATVVTIPAGTFWMGSNDGDPDERPVHPVTLRGFRIDLTEVTVEEYGACADSGECRPLPRTAAWPGIRDEERRFFSAACNGAIPGRRSHPANCVDWNDARAFCAYRGGRLPTEAEWEYAARGRRGQPFPWGDAAPSPALANALGLEAVTEWARRGRTDAVPLYRDGTDGYADTAPVGTYPQGASPFGVLDMAGNVWEWVEDAYGAGYSDASERGDAHADPNAPRVFRGGGYTSDRASWLQATNRASAPEAYRSPDIGFRCAYPLDTAEPGSGAAERD